MAERMDFRHAYHKRWREEIETLRSLRVRGVTFYRFGQAGSICDPSRLSDSQIDRLAREHAERVICTAINKHNEDVARGGRG